VSATSNWAARVPTASGSRYLQQLCKHWGHKMTVVFTEGEGTIDFPDGCRLELRAGDDTLDLLLGVAPTADAARMRQVVEEHLDRFAFREGPLTYDWREASSR
jgi:uncharacterized protein